MAETLLNDLYRQPVLNEEAGVEVPKLVETFPFGDTKWFSRRSPSVRKGRLNRPQSWVSKVQIGERRLDLEELRQIAETLDLDLIKLIKK